MNSTMWELIKEKVTNDFNEFESADEPIKKYCTYHRLKHIQMATQIINNFVEIADYVSPMDINDMVHGLNHLFFYGVAAGQTLKQNKEKKNES